jgi:hypothetical protein
MDALDYHGVKVKRMGCCGSSGSGKNNDEYQGRKDTKAGSSNDEALKVLGVRLAKGEITKQEYAELKETIEK